MDPAQDESFTRPPEEIAGLLKRQGALQPAGGLLYSEADTRNFHEILFVVHQTVSARPEGLAGFERLIAALLAYYTARFRGWYGLEESAKRIEAATASLDYSDTPAFLAGLEDLMAVAGRINLWIDAQMPWCEVNETLKRIARRS